MAVDIHDTRSQTNSGTDPSDLSGWGEALEYGEVTLRDAARYGTDVWRVAAAEAALNKASIKQFGLVTAAALLLGAGSVIALNAAIATFMAIELQLGWVTAWMIACALDTVAVLFMIHRAENLLEGIGFSRTMRLLGKAKPPVRARTDVNA